MAGLDERHVARVSGVPHSAGVVNGLEMVRRALECGRPVCPDVAARDRRVRVVGRVRARVIKAHEQVAVRGRDECALERVVGQGVTDGMPLIVKMSCTAPWLSLNSHILVSGAFASSSQ